MSTDITFFTNEPGQTLLSRFQNIIEDNTRFFDVLVGYFRTSGFYHIYKSLEKTERIRILIGISTNRHTYNLIQSAKSENQLNLKLSQHETKEDFSQNVSSEMDNSPDKHEVQKGVEKFIEWIKSGKLEIRVYPSALIHAKVYIMTFGEGDRDKGRVITGSSNFTESGLIDNLEFNVELKNPGDYDFALRKFNDLWEDSVPVSENYIETINTKTWLKNTITPYELYLKFLYEYFREKINLDLAEIQSRYLPEKFLDLKYQKEAIWDVKSKLEEYGGVFLSDVVGLGKTYVSALLAQQLDGKHLIIAPPALLNEKNPGSWLNVFRDFGVVAYFKSVGKLEEIIKEGTDRYKNVFIDEAHRFRTETNISYEMLAQVCRGKRVILVSATPLNNYPKDILSQIKLFQSAHKCTLPNPKVRDLERFFNRLHERIKNLDRQQDYDEYIKVTKENAKEIRENVLKYLMVRRTRSEIVKYFGDDLQKQGLKFPEVADPIQVYYKFDTNLNKIFTDTIRLIASEDFTYSRYTPLLYLKGGITQPEEISQRNMGRFMKILLVKRLESSFYAFKNTLKRFIKSYEAFIREYDKGHVYVSKKHINKLFELLENDDEKAIQQLIDEDKAKVFNSNNFRKELRKDLENDRNILKTIQSYWKTINYDPKIDEFISRLKNDAVLKSNKIIVFTESKETCDYLVEGLTKEKEFTNIVLGFSGKSGADIKEKVIDNFDARAKQQKNDYRILITTEVLSEGVNLHRSNVVINYDIPWNPTRVIQRVGRINRVDTKFEEIYTYNFFPTDQSETEIGLKAAAEAKINAFIEMLGTDARLLTDGEPIKSHEIFKRLSSKKLLTGEDIEEDPEHKYLKIIRDIRDNEPDLFEKTKKLPKKARTAKKSDSATCGVATFFRKGKLRKFFLANENKVAELDFAETAELFESKKDYERENLPDDFYKYLDKNKKEFETATIDEARQIKPSGGRSSEKKLITMIKAIRKNPCFTDEDEAYLDSISKIAEQGILPKQTSKTLIKEIGKEKNQLKILAILRIGIPAEFFKPHISETSADTSGIREVILSEYLVSDD